MIGQLVGQIQSGTPKLVCLVTLLSQLDKKQAGFRKIPDVNDEDANKWYDKLSG